MPLCPACNDHNWPDSAFGDLPCPNCRTIVRLHAGGLTTIPRHFVYRSTSGHASRRKRDQAVVNGKVLCSLCHGPVDPPSSVSGNAALDGELITDGTQRIDVQIGWTLGDDGSTFYPAYAPRVIPKRIRGLFCLPCSASGTFRSMVKLERPRDERILSKHDGDVNPTAEYALDRFSADYDPSWAHSGDPSWLAGASQAVVDGQRIPVNHSIMCNCPRCMRRACGLAESARMVSAILINAAHLWRPLSAAPRAPKIGRPAPAHGAPFSIEHLIGIRTRHAIAPAIAARMRSLGAAPDPLARNRCKHGIHPYRVWDAKRHEAVYTCSVCAPRPATT